LILGNSLMIGPEHIRFELAGETAAPGVTTQAPRDVRIATRVLADSLHATERDLILAALRDGEGDRRSVAERLGISARTLRYKLARLREAGVDVPAA
jgi:two-component system, response regulator FlrC